MKEEKNLNIVLVWGDSLNFFYEIEDVQRPNDFWSKKPLEAPLKYEELKLPTNTKIEDIFRSLDINSFFDENSIEYITTYAHVIKRAQLTSKVRFKNKEDVKQHHTSTLEELGIADGEVLIIDKIEITRRDTGINDNVLNSIKTYSSPTSLFSLIKKNIPEKPDSLHMLLLYTDADVEITRFIRESYVDLHWLSGSKIHLYALEKFVIEGSVSNYVKYWRSLLSEKLFIVWASIGWLRTKPYDKTQCYEIAKRFGVSPENFPCAILFDEPSPERTLIFPMKQPYIDFFRTLFVELDEIINPQNIVHHEIETVFSSLYDAENSAYEGLEHFGENPTEKEQELYKEAFQELYAQVKAEYSKILGKISTIAQHKAGNEYIFYGKTVFINHPTKDIYLNNLQND